MDTNCCNLFHSQLLRVPAAVFGLGLLFSQNVVALPYLEDGFNYPPGILGTNATWANPTNLITVINGSLAYPGLTGFSPAGGAVHVAQSSAANPAVTYRLFDTAAGSGSVYWSFLIQFTSVNANVYIAGLLPSSLTIPGGLSTDPCDLAVKYEAGGYTLGIRAQGVGATYTTNVLSLNTVYFVVVRYNFAARRASLYLNPHPHQPEPAAPTIQSTSSAATANLNKLFLRSGGLNAGHFMMDSVRIASSWDEVTPDAPIYPADKLTFAAAPSLATAGRPVARTVVQIQNPDAFDIGSNNVPVTLNLDTGVFSAGTITRSTDAKGQAVFDDLVVATAGTFTLTASASGIGTGLAPATGATLVIGPANAVNEQGRAIVALLDSLEVERYWKRGVSVNWFTGAEGGTGTNKTKGEASHCSSFAPAVARLLGVYLLTQSSEVSDLGLANRQADWLRTNTVSGWFPIAGHIPAQHIANTGAVVVASLKEEDGSSGHIAVVRPSIKCDAEIAAVGPQISQSGMVNYNETDAETGFSYHTSPLSRIRYYGHGVTNVPPPVHPFFRDSAHANGVFRAGIVSIVGRRYLLQRTDDFVTWTDVLSYTNSNEGTEFFCETTLTDPAAAGSPLRCYRLLAR